MEFEYKIKSINNEPKIVGVRSHYFTRTEAKEFYLKSKETKEVIDDSIMIFICSEGVLDGSEMVSFGVEEGERFALALLNICYAIKN